MVNRNGVFVEKAEFEMDLPDSRKSDEHANQLNLGRHPDFNIEQARHRTTHGLHGPLSTLLISRLTSFAHIVKNVNSVNSSLTSFAIVIICPG